MATKNTPAVTKGGALVNYKERMMALAKQSVESEASVSTGQMIGTKAGQFSWNGQPVAGNKLEVIVADYILENAYYPGDYDSDNPQPPTCFAFGRNDAEMAPHPDSVDKQSDKCSTCPMNKFGTADKGKGKACKNIRRIGLIAAKPLTEDALSKGEVAYLKTPVTSGKAWAAYVRGLEALQGLPPQGVITEIGSVPDPKTQFKLTFNMKDTVPEKFIPIVLARHEEVKNAIEFPYAPPSDEAPPAKSAKKPARGSNKKY